MSYDAPPPAPHGGYGGPAAAGPHPKATTILILGILGLVCCGPLGIVAWVMGNGAMKEVKAGQYQEDTSLKVGRILGMVATILMAVGIVIWIILLATGAATMTGEVTTTP